MNNILEVGELGKSMNNILEVGELGKSMNNILEVSELGKKYDSFTLSKVSFALPRGYIMGFIGPNGAGKTTTIKLILGVIKSDGGTVRMFGDESTVTNNEQVGVVLDAPLYVDDWKLRDVQTAVAPFYPKWDSKKFAGYLQRFGLDPTKRVKELSRGMKIKIQIAVALSHDAQLLILDEPTSGLDPVARDEICDLLHEFVADEDKGVLFSTHITSDLDKTADYITFILDGAIVFTGTRDGLLEKYVRVTGGLGDLNEEERRLVIGYREHGTGFEGMVEAVHVDSLPKDVLTEEASLEEIVIFMNKGAS